jgi:hypothetical protein
MELSCCTIVELGGKFAVEKVKLGFSHPHPALLLMEQTSSEFVSIAGSCENHSVMFHKRREISSSDQSSLSAQEKFCFS